MTILVLDEKLSLLNDHWLIMKQANELRTENLLLTQACANQFWSEHHELSANLQAMGKELAEIRPRSTSREHIEREQDRYKQLLDDFSNNQQKFQEILEHSSAQLLTLISTNPDETEEIQRSLDDLKNEYQRVETHLHTCQNELERAMIESAEFNAKLERVSTWFDDTALDTTGKANDEFERIRTFKENLDCKYLDIVNLRQDFTDIEHHRQQQQRVDEAKREPEQKHVETVKTHLVEEQLDTIDSKWSQLNEKIQEQ